MDILLLDGPAAPDLARAFRTAAGCVVHRVGTVEELVEALGAGEWELVAVEVDEGLGCVRKARAADGEIPLVAVAAHGDVDAAARAVAAGATDFLVRGPRLEDRVATVLTKLRPLARLRRQHRRLYEAERARWALLGESRAMRALRDQVRRVAGIPRPVLVVGERGTGKELVARALHDEGGPPNRPMVAVNCAAFPENLIESELFGHERGAFTGAERRVVGKFEQAHGGTLFLDEIATMSLPFQQKVLRAVEYGTFTRVGGTEEVRSTARIVAATNADLPARIASGAFLPDLYDRLSFEILRVPPLRERDGDVELLAAHFLTQFRQEIPTLTAERFAPDALAALRAWAFPGNVRELRHVVERAAYREGGGVITAADLGLPEARVVTGGFEARVDAFRGQLLREALDAAHGNQAAAARALDLTYDQFRYLRKRYGGG